MEEKKVLHDEKMEEVSGGRKLTAKEFSALDSAEKAEYLRTAKKLDLKSFEIPKELLDKVSGGSDDEDDCLVEVWDQCPRCGADLYGHIVLYGYAIDIDYFVCKSCNGKFYSYEI